MINYIDLNSEFLAHRFPEFEEEIQKQEEWLGEFLPHCIFGDVLNEKVADLLKKEDYLQNGMLQRTFRMYEDFAVQGDEETQNLLEVTLLEYLWDEKVTYDRALELMGDDTKRVWDHIQGYLKIPEK